MPPTNEAFRKAFLAWEAQAAAQWTALLRNPDFMRRMWRQMEQQWIAQRRLQSLIQTQLTHRQQPPTADDQGLRQEIATAREQVADLQRQLDALAAHLEEGNP